VLLQRFTLMFVFAVLGVACTQSEAPASVTPDPRSHDFFSFANTDEFVNEHLQLDLHVDFVAEELQGSATLRLRRETANATEIILDTRDLTIESAHFELPGGDSVIAAHRFGETRAILGTPLVIAIPDELQAAEELLLTIDYRTSPASTALQWLPPELTAGGEHPFLFSQSQAIHARSWVPLQDTPAVRITYNASIHTPPQLMAIMSANNDPNAERDGDYEFEMPQPIPPYLLALAVGNIYFAPIGDQTGVYTEPELLEASAYEFADTQDMLDKAAAMFGPYQWGRYDLLILPPSFPYGGMENPRLSFITPSVLAGDRSLVAIVAHELAHSWSGNLVTNATWRDGWLNEGWTSYLEHRLMEVIYSEERAAELAVVDYRELLLDLEVVPLEQQALAPPFESGDPDDFQGIIHYHKGNLLLKYLEESFGRDIFDEFIAAYFGEFAFGTITSEVFLDYLDDKLLSAHEGKVSRTEVEEWLYQPGLPITAPIPVSVSLDAAANFATQWSQGEIDIADVPAADWSPQGTIHFINSLDADLSEEQLVELDTALGLSDTHNAEIGRTWFIQVAKRQFRPGYGKLDEYVNRFGRTRLVKPLYQALVENGSDATLAREMFDRARGLYHPVTVTSVELILE
jgi:leukotriene-A4 hydrolase